MTGTTQSMTHEERERHIKDCTALFLDAYARFEAHGLPCDRDAALVWLHVRDAAVRDKLDDEGNNYFDAQGARDGQALRQGGAHA